MDTLENLTKRYAGKILVARPVNAAIHPGVTPAPDGYGVLKIEFLPDAMGNPMEFVSVHHAKIFLSSFGIRQEDLDFFLYVPKSNECGND